MDIERYLRVTIAPTPFTLPVKTEYWGDVGTRLVAMSAGFIEPQEKSGELDFVSRLAGEPVLKEPFVPEMMNKLLFEGKESLVRLSSLCKENAAELDGVDLFWSGKGFLRQMMHWPGFEVVTLLHDPNLYERMLIERKDILERLFTDTPKDRVRFNRVFTALGTLSLIRRENLISNY